MRSLKPSALLLLLLSAFGWGVTPAQAAPGDVVVPNVTGSASEVAVQALEAQGLNVTLVDVAGPPVGRVERQEPPAGARVPTGTEVVLRVGIALRIETRAPDLRGVALPEIGPALEKAYVLELELVNGPPHQDGRILDQNPAPGQTLLFRGVLVLRVVQSGQAGAAGVIVPVLIGRTEAQALDVLHALGLGAGVEYVADPSRPAGTVLSQDPASGAQILSGGLVSLRVAGAPGAPTDTQAVPVPNLVGLSMNAALQAAQAAGFVAQAQFTAQSGGTPWTCIGQQPPAGTPLPAGSALTLTIALPQAAPQHVTAPTLFGLSQAQAVQMLAAMGLSAQVQHSVSGFPAGLVFAQDPQAGATLPAGSPVKVYVAVPPQGGWNPGFVQVPNVVGLSPAQAFQALQNGNLHPKAKQHLVPNQPVDVVDAQTPSAGATVAPGTEVRFYVPQASLVPTLIGKSRNDAIQALQGAGFNPQPQGPAFGLGETVVIAQGAPAGVPLARGSTVAFAFKYQGGGIGAKVQVPDVMGLTKNAAASMLQQKGLGVDLQHQGPFLPGSGTKVTSQGPPAGALVNPGTVVQVVYIDVMGGGGGGNLVQVPDLSGMTVPQAQQALAAAQLQGAFQQQGPSFPGGTTKVVSQQPSAGQPVATGSQVQATFVSQPAMAQNTTVPNLVGLTVADAQQALAAKALQGNFVLQGFALPGGVKKVIGQSPPAGAVVAQGSTVSATYVHQLQIQPKVIVPNVVGMKRADAKATLEGMGLVVQFNGPGQPNKQKVVSQQPIPNTQVAKGSTVTMIVMPTP
jgi:beta-lactam-binding protein with PASTA domain